LTYLVTLLLLLSRCTGTTMSKDRQQAAVSQLTCLVTLLLLLLLLLLLSLCTGTAMSKDRQQAAVLTELLTAAIAALAAATCSGTLLSLAAYNKPS
jgi:hypothetical protein